MVDQTSVNGRVAAGVPGSSSVGFDGVAEFVDDLASLAELQARLAAVDFRDAARKSAIPIVLTVAGLALIVASVPVALLGAGWLIASALKIHQGWAMLLTAGVAIGPRGTGGGVGRDAAQVTASKLPPLAQATLAQPGMGPDRPCHQRQRTLAPAASFVTAATRRDVRVPDGSLRLNRDPPREPESHRQIPQQRSPTTMAINVQTIQGEWNYLCDLARQRWSQLTEDDLRVQEENIEQLIGRIQQKTGEGREAIENSSPR